MWHRTLRRAAAVSATLLLRSRHHLFPPLSPQPSTALPSLLLPFSSLSAVPPPPQPSLSSSSSSSAAAAASESDTDDTNLDPPPSAALLHDVDTIVSALRDISSDAPAAKRRLDNCGITPSQALSAAVLSRLRHDWSAAFTFFLWSGPDHSLRDYHSIISILGKARRFDTAWSLVDEMRRRHTPSLVSSHTLLILIRRYAAIHDVARAINAFYAFKRFGLKPAIDDFHGLLSALCRYKNVEDAEHLLLCNDRTFPFQTKSFNIVLNGWCNVLVQLHQAKRFWREMGNRGIDKDAVSYGSMISCFSKAGNLNDVLKLFNRMKDAGVAPDRKVYNAVVYALAKGRCVEAARDLVKTMEEKGVAPDAVTFNSLIKPLCKARRVDDARVAFDEMLKRGLSPSIRTYHAFFDVLRSAEEVFELLDKMKQTGCRPENDTYIMLIRKLCRWRQHDSVVKLWNEMLVDGSGHDRSAYIVLIHGLFMNGKLDEAFKYYEEMKAKGFEPEPKTEEMIQAWLSGKEASRVYVFDGSKPVTDPLARKMRRARPAPRRDFQIQPEIRTVQRERGFSLW